LRQVRKNLNQRKKLSLTSSRGSPYSTLVSYGFSDNGVNKMAKWLKLNETAEYTKMGRSTLYKTVNEGRIPAHKEAA